MVRGNRRAAWTLALLVPVIAELGLGSTKPSMAYLLILWLPIYGAGILLLREAVRRAGRGWASIILLGLAYELVEDGIGLQALSSPTIYGAAEWGPRLLGLNLPYWEANAIYHIAFSAIIPIFIVDLLFPSHHDQPYLKKGGLVITAVVWLLGIAVIRLAVPPSVDPGYQAPAPVLVGVVITVAALAVIALKIIPPVRPRPTGAGATPTRPVMWVVGAAGTVVIMFLVFPLHGAGATGPAFISGALVWLPMAAAIIVATAVYVLIRRWAATPDWTDRHGLALAGGALPAHTVMGGAAFWPSLGTFDIAGLAVLVIAEVVLVLLIDRRLQRRTEPATPTTRPAETQITYPTDTW